MRVLRWDPDRDGLPSEAALRQRLESLGYRVARYVYPPGTVFPLHTHDADKMDAVVAGRFAIEIEGVRFELGPGDMIEVPRGTRHAAAVLGDEPVVSLDGTR